MRRPAGSPCRRSVPLSILQRHGFVRNSRVCRSTQSRSIRGCRARQPGAASTTRRTSPTRIATQIVKRQMYGRHDSNQEIGPILAGIGTARIIEAAVPLSRMRLISFPGNQMTQQFWATRGVDVSDRDYVDMTELPVPADRIRAGISRSEAAFEALTGMRYMAAAALTGACPKAGRRGASEKDGAGRPLRVGYWLPWFVSEGDSSICGTAAKVGLRVSS